MSHARPQNPLQRSIWIPKLVLPNSDNAPAEPLKLFRYSFVPKLVSRMLCFPVIFVGSWPAIAMRTAVPKASVNKNSDLVFAKHEVWISEESLSPTPARNTFLSKYRDQAQFGIFVPVRLDPCHHFGTLCLRKYVSHVACRIF